MYACYRHLVNSQQKKKAGLDRSEVVSFKNYMYLQSYSIVVSRC